VLRRAVLASSRRLSLLAISLVLPAAMPAHAAGEGGCLSGSGNRGIEILAHHLDVTLTPVPHRLVAIDRLVFKVLTPTPSPASFALNAALRVGHIYERKGDHIRSVPFTSRMQDAESGTKGSGEQRAERSQCITLDLEPSIEPGQVVTLEWNYDGLIEDPPREPRHLRFVTPSETAGHIGSEGIYLSGETHWYPDRPRSLASYRLRVTLPEGWEAVSQGREISRHVSDGAQDRSITTDWEVSPGTEALTLVANRFIKTKRDWRDSSERPIEVAAYLFPEDAHLAQEYLDASARYLETYTQLLGPYPFPKFAVVENFFASGLGMPSFTLLGSGVIKRHYVQPFALGHEIVHSWLGNWVFNDVEQGNWVEGLTTYLANYYYDELTGKPGEAREQRRRMLLEYAVYVRSDEDYPVGRFRQKTGQRDNAIGYQKAAMVFHMLRREIGDAAFWSGLRTLISRHGGGYATWRDVERAFEESGHQDLRWFFVQWVERPGAPLLKIEDAGFQVVPAEAGTEPRVTVTLRVRQAAVGAGSEPYRLRLPVAVKLTDGKVHTELVDVMSADQVVTLSLPAKPTSLRLDADFDIFRRLPREQVPPMLNLFVTDRERSLVLPEIGSETEQAPYRELREQIASREPTIRQVSSREAASAGGSVLILGGPRVNPAAEWMPQLCGEISLGPERFTVGGRTYDDPSMALLLSCRRADRPGSVVTLFYGLTPPAAAKVARLLFFYGWQSYLVFRDGTVVARGDFASQQGNLEVQFAER
jgi:aminopeptidase N